MNNDNRHSVQDSLRNREEKRCTLVGMTSDVCLSVLKIVTGFVGHSSAILADGIHSISDTVTDALVYAMVRLSGKGADERYRYGRGKYETLAAFLISIILVVVALGLLFKARPWNVPMISPSSWASSLSWSRRASITTRGSKDAKPIAAR